MIKRHKSDIPQITPTSQPNFKGQSKAKQLLKTGTFAGLYCIKGAPSGKMPLEFQKMIEHGVLATQAQCRIWAGEVLNSKMPEKVKNKVTNVLNRLAVKIICLTSSLQLELFELELVFLI